MKVKVYYYALMAVIVITLCSRQSLFGQQGGAIEGLVTLQANGQPLCGASVLVAPAARRAITDENGRYRISGLPPGRYEVMAHMHPLGDAKRTVKLEGEETVTVDFALAIAPIHEEITVTAAGREQLPLETFQSVTSLELADLMTKAATSLGEVLEGEAGVAKRSFGPGSSRPVIRGFDGDRVLIMQDGMPTGTLGSQSGDHAEPVDVGTIERVEVVRGPATLLYGTNALGGVVNVITEHHQEHEHAHVGVRGFLTGTGGTNNGLAGGSGGFEWGAGQWLLIGVGGGTRNGDYSSPSGVVANSGAQIKNTAVSLGRFGGRGFFRANYGIQDGLYGVPVHLHSHAQVEEASNHADDHEHGPVKLDWRRQNARLTGGLLNLGSSVEKFTVNLDYSDWHHQELAGGVVGTEFFNRQWSYRAFFNQKPKGSWIGSFGVNGLRRSYKVRGEEQITPEVTQTGFAIFGLEEVSVRQVRLQAGGRLETNRYHPKQRPERSFTGFSGSAGVNLPLWPNGVAVASYSYSYRAPAIEELYNYGPHHGNLAFEIGDPNLARERANGVELGLRHRSARLHAEAGFFYYRLSDYVYLAPTGKIEDGLAVAAYRQADARYRGAEALVHIGLRPQVWLNLGMDTVNAELRDTRTPLPRIPPLRGRIGLEAQRGNFSIKPELTLVARQDRVYVNETPTAGYALLNLDGSYTLVRRNALHILSVSLFNATDRLYLNHVSLIKDYVPEIGRGVRLAYTVRFF